MGALMKVRAHLSALLRFMGCRCANLDSGVSAMSGRN